MSVWENVWKEKKRELILGGVMGLIGSLLAAAVVGVITWMVGTSVTWSLLVAALAAASLTAFVMMPKVEALCRAANHARFCANVAGRIRDKITSIPSAESDEHWSPWLNELEGFLRGMGGLRGADFAGKAKILRSLIAKTAGNRTATAREFREFIESLAVEVEGIPPER